MIEWLTACRQNDTVNVMESLPMQIQTQLQQIPNIHEWDSMQSAGKIIVILKYK